jgi:hypothetical protein
MMMTFLFMNLKHLTQNVAMMKLVLIEPTDMDITSELELATFFWK